MTASPETGGAPSAGEVFGALREAATQLGSFVSHMVDDQPAVALAAALGAGFIAGGGLTSPLGTRLTATAFRAGLTNVGTLAALDLLRRALEDKLGTQGNGTA